MTRRTASTLESRLFHPPISGGTSRRRESRRVTIDGPRPGFLEAPAIPDAEGHAVWGIRRNGDRGIACRPQPPRGPASGRRAQVRKPTRSHRGEGRRVRLPVRNAAGGLGRRQPCKSGNLPSQTCGPKRSAFSGQRSANSSSSETRPFDRPGQGRHSRSSLLQKRPPVSRSCGLRHGIPGRTADG